MNPQQDKNQSPPSHHQDSYSERVVPSKDKMADTEDNLKKEKFATNPNLLHHKRIWKQAKSETLKQIFEIINKEEIFGEDDLTFKYLILQKLKELETK